MAAAKYGPWALIVGGSEGVGAEFARLLAAQKINLVLVARRPGPLQAIAREIRASSTVTVHTHSLDMTADGASEMLIAATSRLEIGLLICNAGAGVTPGPFIHQPEPAAVATLRLNVLGPTLLGRHFGHAMAARGRGGMMFIGSGAGEIGMADVAVYSAAKAYLRTLAEALWFELGPHGVDVLGLVLDVTRTPQLGRLGYPIDDPDVPGSHPRDVALAGLARLAHGPVHYVADTSQKSQTGKERERREAVRVAGDTCRSVWAAQTR